MGLINKIFTSLGFEGETEKENTVMEVKRKKKTYQNFNLHQTINEEKKQTKSIVDKNVQNISINSVLVHTPRNHGDIQMLLDNLANNQASIINLGETMDEDKDRILDFLSGGVYALRGTINRLQGDLFIITPKSVNIIEIQKNK